MFRRRRVMDGRLDRIVAVVEDAKADLVAAVPSPRGIPGRPVADAVIAFEEGLRRAASELSRWRPAPAEERTREALAAAVDEARARAERLRLEAPTLDYEGLVSVLGDLIAPLDAFADAVQFTSRRWPDSSSGTS